MVPQHHNIANRIHHKFLQSLKALLGQALPPWTLTAQIVLFYRACRSLNTQQIELRTLSKYIFPRGFPDKQRLTSGRPDARRKMKKKRLRLQSPAACMKERAPVLKGKAPPHRPRGRCNISCSNETSVKDHFSISIENFLKLK
eukprot:1146824-Pelagomonas_calceolata.AAC.2